MICVRQQPCVGGARLSIDEPTLRVASELSQIDLRGSASCYYCTYSSEENTRLLFSTKTNESLRSLLRLNAETHVVYDTLALKDE